MPTCWIAAAILYLPANLLPIMNTSSLFDSQRDTIVSLAWFEYYLGKGDTARAMESAARVQERLLLPPQLEWFRKARSRLEPRK